MNSQVFPEPVACTLTQRAIGDGLGTGVTPTIQYLDAQTSPDVRTPALDRDQPSRAEPLSIFGIIIRMRRALALDARASCLRFSETPVAIAVLYHNIISKTPRSILPSTESFFLCHPPYLPAKESGQGVCVAIRPIKNRISSPRSVA